MIEIDSYDPIIIHIKRELNLIYFSIGFNMLFSVQESRLIRITFVLIGFNWLFSAFRILNQLGSNPFQFIQSIFMDLKYILKKILIHFYPFLSILVC